MTRETVLEDLIAEQGALDAVLAPLDPSAWELPTPSPGWTISQQVAHLSYFDRAAAKAITDPAGFAEERDAMIGAAMADPDALDALTLGEYQGMEPAELLALWREADANSAKQRRRSKTDSASNGTARTCRGGRSSPPG